MAGEGRKKCTHVIFDLDGLMLGKSGRGIGELQSSFLLRQMKLSRSSVTTRRRRCVTCSRWTRDLIESKEKKGYFRDFRNSVPANNVYHKIGDAEFNTLIRNLLTGNLNVLFRQIPPPPLPLYKTMEFLEVLGLKTRFSNGPKGMQLRVLKNVICQNRSCW